MATNSRCGTLSGGQRARVVFAAAAHSQPHLLFLDEPTNHLDMTTIHYLSEAVAAFAGAVVLVSHNRDLVSAMGPDAELWEVGNAKVRTCTSTLHTPTASPRTGGSMHACIRDIRRCIVKAYRTNLSQASWLGFAAPYRSLGSPAISTRSRGEYVVKQRAGMWRDEA